MPRERPESWGYPAPSANGSGAPTRYLPNAAARPISASRVGPSSKDTRHVGRSHPTAILTCASSDSTIDHTKIATSCDVTPMTIYRHIHTDRHAKPTDEPS